MIIKKLKFFLEFKSVNSFNRFLANKFFIILLATFIVGCFFAVKEVSAEAGVYSETLTATSSHNRLTKTISYTFDEGKKVYFKKVGSDEFLLGAAIHGGVGVTPKESVHFYPVTLNAEGNITETGSMATGTPVNSFNFNDVDNTLTITYDGFLDVGNYIFIHDGFIITDSNASNNYKEINILYTIFEVNLEPIVSHNAAKQEIYYFFTEPIKLKAKSVENDVQYIDPTEFNDHKNLFAFYEIENSEGVIEDSIEVSEITYSSDNVLTIKYIIDKDNLSYYSAKNYAVDITDYLVVNGNEKVSQEGLIGQKFKFTVDYRSPILNGFYLMDVGLGKGYYYVIFYFDEKIQLQNKNGIYAGLIFEKYLVRSEGEIEDAETEDPFNFKIYKNTLNGDVTEIDIEPLEGSVLMLEFSTDDIPYLFDSMKLSGEDGFVIFPFLKLEEGSYRLESMDWSITDEFGNRFDENLIFSIDTTAPLIKNIFHDSVNNKISYTFSELIKLKTQPDEDNHLGLSDISNIDITDLKIVDVDGDNVPVTIISFSYSDNNSLVFTYEGDLSEGSYSLDFSAYDIADAAGNSMTEEQKIGTFTVPAKVVGAPVSILLNTESEDSGDNKLGIITIATTLLADTEGSGVGTGVDSVTVLIPTDTIITGSSTWDGTIAAPQIVEDVDNGILVVDSGQKVDTATVLSIKVGSASSALSFDKPVKINFPGKAGSRVGWLRPGTDFTEIVNTCNLINNPSVAANSACKINSADGKDLIVWTRHFTTFVSYGSTPSTPPSSGGGSSGGGIAIMNSCSAITYSDWGQYINGFQFRNVLTKSPGNCSLSTEQQISLHKACLVDGNKEVNEEITTPSDLDVSAIINKERQLVIKKNTSLINRLLGRILLQVEENGEAWYLEPLSKAKHFMGRPADAFLMMRRYGLGVTEANFVNFTKNGVPSRLAGRILLRVEENGEAYYINPIDLKMRYLGRPADAFRIMKELALGISNINLHQIPVVK